MEGEQNQSSLRIKKNLAEQEPRVLTPKKKDNRAKPKTKAQQEAFNKMLEAKTKYWNTRKVVTKNKKDVKKKIKGMPYVDEEEQMLLNMLAKVKLANANKLTLEEIEQIPADEPTFYTKNEEQEQEEEEQEQEQEQEQEEEEEEEQEEESESSEEIIIKKKPRKEIKKKKTKIVYVTDSDESEEVIQYVKKPIKKKVKVIQEKIVMPKKRAYIVPDLHEEEPIQEVARHVQYKQPVARHELRIQQQYEPEYEQPYYPQPTRRPAQPLNPLNSFNQPKPRPSYEDVFRDSHFGGNNDNDVFGM